VSRRYESRPLIETFDATTPTVLVIDDDPGARMVVRLMLASAGLNVVEHASATAAMAHLSPAPDVIVMDVMMPELDGITACRMLRSDERTRDTPVLMMTAADSRDRMLACIAAGADDFIAKPFDRDELQLRVTTHARHGRARRAAEARRRLDSIVTTAPIGIAVVRAADGTVAFANAAAEVLLGTPCTGVTIAQLIAEPVALILARELACGIGTIQSACDGDWPEAVLLQTGKTATVSWSHVSWQGAAALQLFIRDVTNERALVAGIRRAEQLTVVARLAAGVAHDLGTLLQVAACHLHELRSSATGAESSAIAGLDASLRRAGTIAARMTALGRRQAQPRDASCDVNAVVTHVCEMGSVLLPATVEFELTVHPGIAGAGIDGPSLESALLNLITNARDAMPRGGRIRLRAEPCHRRAGWTIIQLADTGAGIAPDTLRQVGQPFITTKAEGAGTGLGLFTIREAMEAVGGTFSIASIEGAGTTVTLELPPPDRRAVRAAPDMTVSVERRERPKRATR